LFTTLTTWLRSARRPARSRTDRLSTALEQLEDRTVLDSTYYQLALGTPGDANQPPGVFKQNWSNTGLISTPNNWNSVPSMEGYSGPASAQGTTDPQLIVKTGGSLTVTPNLADPSTTPTNPTAGIAEFDGLADPTVALASDANFSAANPAPYLLLYLNTQNTGHVTVSFTVRDVDGSGRNAIEAVDLQYRVITPADQNPDFIPVPGGFVSSATTGSPNQATKATNVTATLPFDPNGPFPVADNQAQVQVRFITAKTLTDAEWVGIDNIVVHGNRPPTIGLDTGTLGYTEGLNATLTPPPVVPISPGATLGDPDSPTNFDKGSLTVSFTNGGAVDDRLIVINQVATPGGGKIGVNGSSVTFDPGSGSVVIGTINANGGVGSTPLVVSLNGNATPTAVLALIQAIGYQNVSDDPIPGTPAGTDPAPRTVQFVLDDGQGGVSAPATRDVVVTAVNDVPVITLPGGPVTVGEQAGAKAVDATATMVDFDSPDFAGGVLTVGFANPRAGDLIAIANQGGGPGQVGVIGSDVYFGVVKVGSFTGGVDGTAPLAVTFNADATNATLHNTSQNNVVQAVLRAITFQFTGDNPPAGPRALQFTLTDGDGGTSLQTQVAVTVTPVDDAPTLTPSVTGGITYTENGPPVVPVVIDPGAVMTDLDSPDFNQGTLTVDYARGGATADDRLSVTTTGLITTSGPTGATVNYNPGTGPVAIGSITSSGVGATKLQVTLNAAATPAAVQALIQSIGFSNVSDDPDTSAPRTVRFVVNDGDGQSSAPVLYTVTVVAVPDGPTIAGVPTALANDYSAGFPAVVLTLDPNTGLTTGTVTDPDSQTLKGGNLTVTVSGAATRPADTVAVRNQGTGAGEIGVSGSNITFGGAANVIGTFTGGTNGNPLVVTFTSDAVTPAVVTALLNNITFFTPNNTNVTGVRTITFQATDDTGTAGAAVSMTVNVTSTAQAGDDFYSTGEDATLVVAGAGATDPLVLANDPDPGPLVVDAIVTSPGDGTLTLRADRLGGFTYVPNPDFNGKDTFTYRWRNTTTNATGTAVVTIFVEAVNDAPEVTLLPLAPLDEDAPAQSIAGFLTNTPGPATATDEAGQKQTVTVTTNNPALFTIPPAIDANGTLTFTLAPTANTSFPGFPATTTITVTVQDDGGTGNQGVDTTAQTVTLVVRPVNDAPTFQLNGTPKAVNEDAGPQTEAGFALSFTPGPATALDEATQTATYVITPISTTGGLTFTAPPAISPAGDLTYTAAPNSSGTATFIVQVNDGGGTLNGGVETSLARTMTITVNPVNDPPTATDDTLTVNWNTAGNVLPVLANDSDAPDAGETLSVAAVTQPAHGTATAIGTAVLYTPLAAFSGTDTFTYTLSDGTGLTATATVTVNVVRTRTDAVNIIALGSGPGGGSLVKVFNAVTGAFVAGFTAFDPAFTGGVSVATGDVNGDGVTDVVVGAGVDGGPRVLVIDGTKFGLLQSDRQIADPSALIANFFAYDPTFRGGVNVAVGDVDGDGKADVIAGTGPGGGPNVKVISGALITRVGVDGLPDASAVLASYFAYDPNFRGGVTVGAGDVNGDGFADVVTAVGPGGGSHVKAYDGRRLVLAGPTAPGVQLLSFFAYGAAFRGGVSVAAGDLNGDGRAEIITGAGAGGGSHVKVFNAANLATTASFLAFGPNFGGGVDVAYRARTGMAPLLLAGAGAGGLPRAVGYAAPSLSVALSINAFDPSFLGGVEVG
jgi:hypothetical protein